MDIEIKEIEEKDIPEVVDIQIGGWQTAYKGIIDQEFLDSMNREKRIESRKKDYKNGKFIVAKIGDEVVGFCRYDTEAREPYNEEFDSELIAIYVKSDKKGLGIGRKMFEYAVEDLRKQNKTKMILWCLKENYPSRAFYEKMGGKVVKEKPLEIGGKIYLEVGFYFEI